MTRLIPLLAALPVLAACAAPGPASVPVPQALAPSACAERLAETERVLAAAQSPEDELRAAPWVALATAEALGRCPDLAAPDGALLRLGNAALFAGQYWLAREAFAELSARFPDSGFNFEDVGGRRAALLEACGARVEELDAYRLGLLDARYGRAEDARRRLGRAGRSPCPPLAEAAREALSAVR
jgi:hypothetical protein